MNKRTSVLGVQLPLLQNVYEEGPEVEAREEALRARLLERVAEEEREKLVRWERRGALRADEEAADEAVEERGEARAVLARRRRDAARRAEELAQHRKDAGRDSKGVAL